MPKIEPNVTTLEFDYFGTPLSVRIPINGYIRLASIDEKSIASAWSLISKSDIETTLADCMELRGRLNLCDWAYIMLLKKIGDEVYGQSRGNDATLLTAYLFCQSGYKMRLGRDNSNTLVLLYASRHLVYGTYFSQDGTNFFPFMNDSGELYLSQAVFPNEKPMDLYISSLPKLKSKISAERVRTSRHFSAFSKAVHVNKNLIDFYNTYPTSEIGGNVMTRWAMYADTQLSAEAKSSFYPYFVTLLRGKNEYEAVSCLLNWVQTGFIYEYDDKVWGHDRAFFPEETLYYPYADCEDRAILFSRLVRDMVGLDVALVFYPGHLASAVAFNSDVKGDYILINGKKFTVCDPTFVDGAPIGLTGDGMNNATAKVIVMKAK